MTGRLRKGRNSYNMIKKFQLTLWNAVNEQTTKLEIATEENMRNVMHINPDVSIITLSVSDITH